jgi:hypothetical protein
MRRDSMFVPDEAGIFAIANYTTNKYFFSYSEDSMYKVAHHHHYKIREGGHVNNKLYELNSGLLLNHNICYYHIITTQNIDSSINRMPYPNIKNKLLELIYALNTFGIGGYNSWTYELRQKPIHTDYGIYLIIVRNQKSGHRKFYIGKGDRNKGISGRISNHKSRLIKGTHRNEQLQYDFSNNMSEVSYSPLITFYEHEISSEELAKLEVHMIGVFQSFIPQRGYNKNAKGLLVHTI